MAATAIENGQMQVRSYPNSFRGNFATAGYEFVEQMDLAGSAPRAVGQACGANMLPLVVPCHRVLAANGIGGYSGAKGLDTKRFLLALEKAGPAG